MFTKKTNEINNDKSISLIKTYVFVALIAFILFVIIGIFSSGKIINLMAMGGDYNTSESDYWRQIVYASDLKNIYFNTDDAPFLPFSYLFYHLLFLINPFSAPIELASYTIARDLSFNSLIYNCLLCIKTIIFYKSIELLLRNKFDKKTIFLFSTMLFLSIPVLFGCIEHGNVIFLLYGLMMLAIYLKDSDNKVYKEIALILIAICAAVKVYPAILGLLYIKEKRFKEAIRLIIYGLLFVFVPFIFTGGIEGLVQYLSVLKTFQTRTIPRYTSISPMILAVVDTFAPQMDKLKVLPFNIIIQNLYLLLNVVSFFKTNRKSLSYIFLCGILSIYVPDSYRYTAGYMIIPFVLLLLEEKIRKIDYVYFVLFVLIFTIPIYAYFINISVIDFCVFMPIYIMSVVAYYDTWLNRRDSL